MTEAGGTTSDDETDDATGGGKHVAHDEIDPELVALRRPVAGLGPLLLISLLTLSVFLFIRLWADLRYALGPKEPRDLGSAAGAWQKDHGFPDGAFVSLEALPDRSWPARLHVQQGTGHRLMPALGTDGALWLSVEGESLIASTAHDERYVGRVRRLDAVPFDEALREWVAKAPPALHFVAPAAVAAAHGAAQPTQLRDVAGDSVSVTADSPVELEERVPDLTRVVVLATDSLSDENRARAALVAAGVVAAPGPKAVESTDKTWTFEVPGAPDEIRAKITTARLYAASAQPKIIRHSGKFGELAVQQSSPGAGEQGDGLRLRDRVIPLATLENLAILAPRSVPAQAWVLLDGQTPETFWYVPILCGGLVLVSLLLIVGFVRSWRAGS